MPTGEPKSPYEAIIRLEIALGLMNRARGLLSEQIDVFAADDPAAAEVLRVRRRELHALQNGLRAGRSADVEAVISEWEPKLRGTAAFWEEV